MVRNLTGRRRGDETLCAPRVERERRFLFRRSLSTARYSNGSLRADFCHWPDAGLDCSMLGTAAWQYSDQTANSL